MNDEAVGLVAQRIKELNLPQPITAEQAVGKTLSRVQEIPLTNSAFIEFSDNTILFIKAEQAYDDCDIVVVDWPNSASLYVYRYLEHYRTDIAKQLEERIRQIEKKFQVAERETCERLKARFEAKTT